MRRLVSRKLAALVLTMWPILGAVVLLARWGADAETTRTLALAVAGVATVVAGAAVTTQGMADVRAATRPEEPKA